MNAPAPRDPRGPTGKPHATTEDQINEMESEGQAQPQADEVDPGTRTREDTHVTKEDSPEGPGIDAQDPDRMPRAEDDEATRAHSPEFHDRPGSGKNIGERQRFFS